MVPDPIGVDSLRRVLVVKLRHHGDVLLSSPVFQRAGERARRTPRSTRWCTPTRATCSRGTRRSRGIHTIDREWKRQGLARCRRGARRRCSRSFASARYQLIVHLTEPLARRLARAAAAPALVGRPGARRAGSGRPELLAPLRAAARPRRATRWRRTSTRCAASGSTRSEEEKRLVMVPGPEAEAKVDALLAQHGLAAEGLPPRPSDLALALQGLDRRAQRRAPAAPGARRAPPRAHRRARRAREGHRRAHPRRRRGARHRPLGRSSRCASWARSRRARGSSSASTPRPCTSPRPWARRSWRSSARAASTSGGRGGSRIAS